MAWHRVASRRVASRAKQASAKQASAALISVSLAPQMAPAAAPHDPTGLREARGRRSARLLRRLRARRGGARARRGGAEFNDAADYLRGLDFNQRRPLRWLWRRAAALRKEDPPDEADDQLVKSGANPPNQTLAALCNPTREPLIKHGHVHCHRKRPAPPRFRRRSRAFQSNTGTQPSNTGALHHQASGAAALSAAFAGFEAPRRDLVVDLGCGFGTSLLSLSRMVLHYYTNTLLHVCLL
jgi:hypothetical protein